MTYKAHSSRSLGSVLSVIVATLPAIVGLHQANAAPAIVGINYQDSKSNPNCNTANCSLAFTVVPAGKNLTIPISAASSKR